MYTLRGMLGGRQVEIPLEVGSHTVGRTPGNSIVLKESTVSSKHAEIVVDHDRVWLQDLGSTNGTAVNGRPVTTQVEVRSGDKIFFGYLELELVAESAEKPAEPSHASVTPESTLTLSRPGEVSTARKLTWEEAHGDPGPAWGVIHKLFRSVTEAGQLLAYPKQLSETLEQVMDLAERVVPARRIVLLLADTPDGTPSVRAARPSHQAASGKLMLSQSIVGTVLRDREALLLNDAQSDPRFRAQESIVRLNLRCAMVAPLFDNEKVIGILYADNDDPRTLYTDDHLRAFTFLANLIAIKITNARLLEAEREKERMEQEVAAAAEVQRSLLSAVVPSVPGYEILVRQQPCLEVGGDLYDITELEDGRIALVVGDVAGKGMSAALLMSNVLASLRVLYGERPDPLRIVGILDQELLRSTDELHYVTLFLGLLDPVEHRLEFVNAGHDPPLLLSADAEPVRLGSTGLPVGILPGSTFELDKVDLSPDSLLCVYSDGIPEAMVGDEFYGEERFTQSAGRRRNEPLAEVADGVLKDLHSFLGENPATDDVTLLLLGRRE